MSMTTNKFALEARERAVRLVLHKPRLLRDNGPSYIAGDLDARIEAFIERYNHLRYH
jgi:putative transposase